MKKIGFIGFFLAFCLILSCSKTTNSHQQIQIKWTYKVLNFNFFGDLFYSTVDIVSVLGEINREENVFRLSNQKLIRVGNGKIEPVVENENGEFYNPYDKQTERYYPNIITTLDGDTTKYDLKSNFLGETLVAGYQTDVFEVPATMSRDGLIQYEKHRVYTSSKVGIVGIDFFSEDGALLSSARLVEVDF